MRQSLEVDASSAVMFIVNSMRMSAKNSMPRLMMSVGKNYPKHTGHNIENVKYAESMAL